MSSTLKDLKDRKELSREMRAGREGKREEHIRGGKRNLLREALEELAEEADE